MKPTHECSRCGGERDRKPHRYCLKCHREYVREWRSRRKKVTDLEPQQSRPVKASATI